MGDEDLGSTFGVVHEHLLEHRPSNMGIQSRERILGGICQSPTENGPKRDTYIEDLNVSPTVDSSANVDTLLLTTRQRDTTFTDLREVAVGEELQVRVQARVGNGLPIPVGIESSTEANVLADGGVLQSDQ